jgi:hypothetical protein
VGRDNAAQILLWINARFDVHQTPRHAYTLMIISRARRFKVMPLKTITQAPTPAPAAQRKSQFDASDTPQALRGVRQSISRMVQVSRCEGTKRSWLAEVRRCAPCGSRVFVQGSRGDHRARIVARDRAVYESC